MTLNQLPTLLQCLGENSNLWFAIWTLLASVAVLVGCNLWILLWRRG